MVLPEIKKCSFEMDFIYMTHSIACGLKFLQHSSCSMAWCYHWPFTCIFPIVNLSIESVSILFPFHIRKHQLQGIPDMWDINDNYQLSETPNCCRTDLKFGAVYSSIISLPQMKQNRLD